MVLESVRYQSPRVSMTGIPLVAGRQRPVSESHWCPRRFRWCERRGSASRRACPSRNPSHPGPGSPEAKEEQNEWKTFFLGSSSSGFGFMRKCLGSRQGRSMTDKVFIRGVLIRYQNSYEKLEVIRAIVHLPLSFLALSVAFLCHAH